MKIWRAVVLALILIVPLSGCQTIRGWFQRDTTEPPAELVEFTPRIEVERVWSTGVGRGISRSQPKLKPIYAGGRIWTVDYRGLLTVIDAESGNRVARIDTELDVSAGPTIFDDRVYLGTFDGEIHVLDAGSGATHWSAQLSSEILSLPVLHDGVLIVRCLDGRVFGLDATNGRRLWVHDRSVPALTLRGTSDILARAGQAFIGYDDGTVIALRVADGSVLWEQPVSVPEGRTELERLADIDGRLVLIGSDLYVVTYRGRLASLTTESGRVLWVKDVSSASGVSVARTRLAVSDRDDSLWLVDRRNGGTLWRDETLLRRQLTRPEFIGDYVVVGDFDGYLHWLDADSGEMAARVRAFRDGFAAAPLVVGNTLYVLSADGDLSAWRVRG